MGLTYQARYVRNLFGRFARLKREYEAMDSFSPFRLLKQREVLAAGKACKKFRSNLDLTPYMESV